MRTFFALGLKEGHLASLIILGVSTIAVVVFSLMTASFSVYSGAIAVAVASAAAGLGQDALNDLTDRFIVAEALRSRPFGPGVFLTQLFGKELTKEVLVCRGLDLGFFDFIRGNGTLGWRF